MLVVIAEKEELKLVEELGYSGYPVLITGVGGLNVVNALKRLSKDTEILNIGYCGSNNLEIGSKVMIRFVRTHHNVADFKEVPLSCITDGGIKRVDCYTSTDFVINTTIKEDCVFDMELAFIRAMFNNVRSIKVVSDKLNYKQYKEKVS